MMGYQIVKKLVPNRISLKYNSIKTKIIVDLPERMKGTIFERLGNFCKNLVRDYADVVRETSADIKQRPKVALAYAWGFWAWLYCVKTNPDEQSFRDQLVSAATDIAFLPSPIRNKESSSHIVFLESCDNAGVLRKLNLGVCSFMWISNYDKAVGLYAANCKYLEPAYFAFHERIVDFGMLGRWWVLNRKMKDFDINPSEWDENGKKIY